MGQYPLGQWPEAGFSVIVSILPVQGVLLSLRDPMIALGGSHRTTNLAY